MPGCRECKWLTISHQCGIEQKFGRQRSPIRNCIMAILLEYHHLFSPGHNVLEVGCGAWSPLKEWSRQKGYRWVGIDVNDTYMGKPTIATVLASVQALPFENETFHWVVATQSMEHWEEYAVDLRQGLSEVFRVLKPDGWALINVPIFLHGGPLFELGKLEAIKHLFQPFASYIHMEAWRYPPAPLPPYRPFLRYYWFKPSLWKQSTYVLDIRAKRKEQVPYFKSGPISVYQKIYTALYYRGPLYYLSLAVWRLIEDK